MVDTTVALVWRDWILFFDEADALFGKRSETNVAHDRYANQEVAYLLQRIESFEGVVILASNLHRNVDEAFLRRFEAVVYFSPPRAAERLRLWQEGFSPRAHVKGGLECIAREHDLTAGAIINVIRKVSLVGIAWSALSPPTLFTHPSTLTTPQNPAFLVVYPHKHTPNQVDTCLAQPTC